MKVAHLILFLLVIICKDVTDAERDDFGEEEGDDGGYEEDDDGGYEEDDDVGDEEGDDDADEESDDHAKSGSVDGPLDLFNYNVSLGGSAVLSLGIGNMPQVSSDALFRARRPGSATDGHGCNRITAVPRHLTFITRYGYYAKYTHAYNIPIISSRNVGAKALKRACYVLRFLLADRRVLRRYLYYNYGRIGIIGRYEQTTHIPEHRFLGPSWNARARGLGGTLAVPISTGTEENLLCERTDRYPKEDIFLHEFSHGIQEVAIRGGGIPGYFRRLQAAYYSARRRGLWRSTYAMSTVQEYFAEGTQSYFHVNTYSRYANGVHGPISTRAKLRTYDPTLYNLVREVFPCGNLIWKRCQAVKGGTMPSFKMNCDGDGVEVTVGGKGGTKKKTTTTKAPVVTQPPRPPIPTKPTAYTCTDDNPYCGAWKWNGHCTKRSDFLKYMMKRCRKSCGCCENVSRHCGDWSKHCGSIKYGKFMDVYCKKTCKTCPKFANLK